MTSIANSKYVTDGSRGPKVLDSPARAMNSKDNQKGTKESSKNFSFMDCRRYFYCRYLYAELSRVKRSEIAFDELNM